MSEPGRSNVLLRAYRFLMPRTPGSSSPPRSRFAP